MRQGEPAENGCKLIVALGGNATSPAGGPRETVVAALDALRGVFEDLASSHLYRTPAFPAGAGPDFINAACVCTTDLSAEDALDALHRIEQEFDRTRTKRWGERTLDLDLIAYADAVLPDRDMQAHWRTLPLEAQKTQAPDELILPHPRVQDRPFVLVPVADVAPDWTHPVLGETVLEMLARHGADARAEIVRVD